MKILVLNSGSSSQKSRLYELGGDLPSDPPEPLWEGNIEWNADRAEIAVRNARGESQQDTVKVESRSQAVKHLLDCLWTGEARVLSGPREIEVAGHRVVHGGPRFTDPTLITPEVKSGIADMSAFAPLHNRAEIEGIEIVERVVGTIPQVAVFDTGFHSQMPQPAAAYAGPYEWISRGIRRYGFHGINHQYCAERTARLLGRHLNSLKMITCHLGNGCSLAAIRDGHSIDTTMGFTPLDGLMMGTRSGSVDPGILTYLMRQDGLTGEQLDNLLNTKSGLLGISGISSDMREIESSMKQGQPRARLAFDMFVHRLQRNIGAMAAILGGLDVLVFTGGIGENSSAVRSAACASLGFMGVTLDAAKNAHASGDQDISPSGTAVRVFVVRAQEDWAIAKECWRIVHARRRTQASVT